MMIKLTDVTKRYGTAVAVDHLSFEVRPGEVIDGQHENEEADGFGLVGNELGDLGGCRARRAAAA